MCFFFLIIKRHVRAGEMVQGLRAFATKLITWVQTPGFNRWKTFDYCKLSFDLSLADISVTTAPGTEDKQDSWSWREDLHPQECHDNRIQLLPEAATVSLTCHNCMSHPEQPSGLCPHSLGWKQVSQQNWKNPHNVRLERNLLLDRRD